MTAVSNFVVDEANVEPSREDGDTASERLTFQTEHLEQRVVRFAPGRSRQRAGSARHELLYVLAGSGQLEVDGNRPPLAPGTGPFAPPGKAGWANTPGREDLPVAPGAPPAALGVDAARRKKTIRFDDQPEHTA